MVPKEDLDPTQRGALESHYQSFRNAQYKENKKKRTWYRLFFPNDADWTVKDTNINAHTAKDNVYNPANGYYATHTNHFGHHLSE